MENAELKIQVGDKGAELSGVPIPLVVMDLDSHKRLERTGQLGKSLVVAVDPGWYRITAQLPTGVAVAKETRVTSGQQARVALEARLRTFDKQLEQAVSPLADLYSTIERSEDCLTLWNRRREFLQLAFWQAIGGMHFRRRKVPEIRAAGRRHGWAARQAASFSSMYLQSPPGEQLWISVKSQQEEWSQFIALPRARQVTIAIGHHLAPENSSRPRVVACGGATPAGALLAFLHHGEDNATRQLGLEMLERQVHHSMDQEAEPMADTAAAYFCLRSRERPSDLIEWLEAFARRTETLPDSNIVYASFLLKQAQPALPKIRELLFSAWQRGLPIYTDGLRRLSTSLDQLRNFLRGGDAELNALRNDVRAIAGCADATVTTTTLRLTGEPGLSDLLDFGPKGLSGCRTSPESFRRRGL